jgi:peptide/nickel transport system permease protein
LLGPGRIVSRLGQLVPTLFLITVVAFVLVRLLPGDPTAAFLGERASDADIARINAQLGLDQPIIVQFWLFLTRLAHGDLGVSINLKRPVLALVAERLPTTLVLTLYAALISLALALPLAFLAALQRDRAADLLIRGIFQVGLSTPVFYLGLLLLTVFAAQLRWFPVGGYGSTWAERLYSLFLPALTLALSLAAILMRNLRAAVIEVLDAEYVEFARAKGLPPRIVLFRHVLRNALISTVTQIGLIFGVLVTNAVIVETVFDWPGMGTFAVQSILQSDHKAIIGFTIWIGALIVIVNLLVDITHSFIDPRGAR